VLRLMEVLVQLIVGFLAIVSSELVARQMMAFQNRTWGLKVGDREVKATRFLLVVFGLYMLLDAIYLLIKR
jgi:hypothetical protein